MSLQPEVTSSPSQLVLVDNNRARHTETVQPKNYDVFISFRGADARYTLLDHIHHRLKAVEKLEVYRDDIDLQRGVEISPTLLQAIERSDVYVVILSRDYANSEWCVEELEKIFECVEKHDRKFIPVTYAMSFADFDRTLLSSSAAGRIGRWRDKLQNITAYAGLDYTDIRFETILLDKITSAVLQAIPRSSEIVKLPRHLVGIDRKVGEVERLWRSESLERAAAADSLIIGLCGMPGIGKTAVARAFVHRYHLQFEAICFFEFPDPPGAWEIRFFPKLMGDGVGGETLFSHLIDRRLGRRKTLVVIDGLRGDSNDIRKLNDLFYGHYSGLFGPGNLVIVTSTNRQHLKSKCHTVYQVEGLADHDAWRLFCFHAFKREDAPPSEYWNLARRAVDYAGGNPLAITLLGSHLYGQLTEYWEGEQRDLQQGDVTNSVVLDIGRKSYDGLSPAEKDLFLNLACFYSYWNQRNLSVLAEVLKYGVITNLVNKCLISVKLGGYITMNQVLRDLGRRIVKEDGPIKKLWRPEDVPLLFKKSKVAHPTIEGIVLDDCWRLDPPTSRGICLQADAFEDAEKLRFLVIGRNTCNLILPAEGFKCLPNELRILEWDSFPSKCLPPEFFAENLIILCLPYSQIEQLWEDEGPNVVRDLGKLKILYLEGSKNLRKLPDLSTAKRLEGIRVSGCSTLSHLPDSIRKLLHLTSLDLSWTGLEELPSSIGDLTRLSELVLTGCKSLSCLPDTIHELNNLQLLLLNKCSQLLHLPRLPSSLEELDARGCKSLQTMSNVDIAENALSASKSTRWWFGGCQNLDEGVRRQVVDKFIRHPVRGRSHSELLMPAKWVAKSDREEGSIMGSSCKNRGRATAKLRGNPWKLKSLFFCIVVSRPPLERLEKLGIECCIIDGITIRDVDVFDLTSEMKTSVPHWRPLRSYEDEDEDEDEQLLSNDHLLLWSRHRETSMGRAVQREAEKAAGADGAAVQFSFYGEYICPEEESNTPVLIKNCRVIPVYDDRVEPREEDDDQYSVVNFQGLYDQLCSGQERVCKGQMSSLTDPISQWHPLL